jgi:hypothetical protein
MRLYCIKIENSRSNRDYAAFHVAMSDLNGKPLDYEGSMSGALVSHSQDSETVWTMITSSLKNPNDVSVTEVTDTTLQSDHFGYAELINKRFLPYDNYPAIQKF